MRGPGLRGEDLLLAAWNAAGVRTVGVSALAPIAGLAAFYASLVVAPRLLVDPEPAGGCLAWPLRFVLYLVSAALGIGWLGGARCMNRPRSSR